MAKLGEQVGKERVQERQVGKLGRQVGARPTRATLKEVEEKKEKIKKTSKKLKGKSLSEYAQAYEELESWEKKYFMSPEQIKKAREKERQKNMEKVKEELEKAKKEFKEEKKDYEEKIDRYKDIVSDADTDWERERYEEKIEEEEDEWDEEEDWHREYIKRLGEGKRKLEMGKNYSFRKVKDYAKDYADFEERKEIMEHRREEQREQEIERELEEVKEDVDMDEFREIWGERAEEKLRDVAELKYKMGRRKEMKKELVEGGVPKDVAGRAALEYQAGREFRSTGEAVKYSAKELGYKIDTKEGKLMLSKQRTKETEPDEFKGGAGEVSAKGFAGTPPKGGQLSFFEALTLAGKAATETERIGGRGFGYYFGQIMEPFSAVGKTKAAKDVSPETQELSLAPSQVPAAQETKITTGKFEPKEDMTFWELGKGIRVQEGMQPETIAQPDKVVFQRKAEDISRQVSSELAPKYQRRYEVAQTEEAKKKIKKEYRKEFEKKFEKQYEKEAKDVETKLKKTTIRDIGETTGEQAAEVATTALEVGGTTAAFIISPGVTGAFYAGAGVSSLAGGIAGPGTDWSQVAKGSLQTGVGLLGLNVAYRRLGRWGERYAFREIEKISRQKPDVTKGWRFKTSRGNIYSISRATRKTGITTGKFYNIEQTVSQGSKFGTKGGRLAMYQTYNPITNEDIYALTSRGFRGAGLMFPKVQGYTPAMAEVTPTDKISVVGIKDPLTGKTRVMADIFKGVSKSKLVGGMARKKGRFIESYSGKLREATLDLDIKSYRPVARGAKTFMAPRFQRAGAGFTFDVERATLLKTTTKPTFSTKGIVGGGTGVEERAALTLAREVPLSAPKFSGLMEQTGAAVLGQQALGVAGVTLSGAGIRQEPLQQQKLEKGLKEVARPEEVRIDVEREAERAREEIPTTKVETISKTLPIQERDLMAGTGQISKTKTKVGQKQEQKLRQGLKQKLKLGQVTKGIPTVSFRTRLKGRGLKVPRGRISWPDFDFGRRRRKPSISPMFKRKKTKVRRKPSLVAIGDKIKSPRPSPAEFTGFTVRPILGKKGKKKKKKGRDVLGLSKLGL